MCVETISHDFKEGLGLLDVLLHLGSFALLKLSGAIITFASFQLDTAQHVRPLTLYRLHHACLTDREDDEREKIFSRIPPPTETVVFPLVLRYGKTHNYAEFK